MAKKVMSQEELEKYWKEHNINPDEQYMDDIEAVKRKSRQRNKAGDFNGLMRDYNDIRELLRDMYIYGCFSAADYEEKGIRGKSYQNKKRIIENFLPEEFYVNKSKAGDKSDGKEKTKTKKPYISYRMEDTRYNFLAESFRCKSFSVRDIMYYFWMLSLFNTRDELKISDLLSDKLLTELADQENFNADIYEDIFSDEQVYRRSSMHKKLNDLVEFGFLERKKLNGEVVFSLKKDLWEEFDNDELKEIYTYIDFMRNTSPFCMPYHFLASRLELYLELEREEYIEEDMLLQYKHEHLFRVLEEEIVFDILQAIHSEKEISVTSSTNAGEKTENVYPVELRFDAQYGRMYFIGLHEGGSIKTYRVDRIKAIDEKDNISDDIRVRTEEVRKKLEDVWCTSGAERECQEIKIEFSFDEEKEYFILRRLKTEGHGGRIEKISDGHYVFTVSLRDPKEIVPWVRSFGERARVISSGSAGVEKYIENEWRKALSAYETV